MFHSSGFAIAAGVVAVGAAATSAAVSMSASDRAAKAQGAASKKATRQEKKALKKQEKAAAQLETDLGQIQAPQWDIGADIGDAERITGYNEQQLERLYPGARNQRQLASMAISDYMRGVVPKDVQEQTQRMLAETGGAGFNFATAGQGMGIQAPQANLARSLGLTSLQLQQTGLGLSRDWQTMASAFIQSPLQVGQARLGFEQAAADIGMQKATAMYNARAGLAGEQRQMAGRQYGRAVDTIESTLAARQAIASGVSDIGQATSSALFTGYQINAANQGLNVAQNPYGMYSNRPIQAGSQISQQYSSGNYPSISDRPVAIPS